MLVSCSLQAVLWLAKQPSFASHLKVLAWPLNKFIHFARWVGQFCKPVSTSHLFYKNDGDALRALPPVLHFKVAIWLAK